MNLPQNQLNPIAFNRFFLLSILLLAGIISSCKTTEELRRERLVNDLSYKMQESEKHLSANQKMTGNQAEKIQGLQDQINILTDKFEQLSHLFEQKNGHDENTQKHIQELNTKQTEMMANQEEIKKYFEEVMSTIKKLKESNSAPSKSSHKKASKSETLSSGNANKGTTSNVQRETLFQEAMKYSQNGDQAKARQILQEVLQGHPSNREKAKIFYNLGLVEYGDKKFDTALTYFSKIVLNFTKSPYVANSYFFLGKSFAAINKPNEAKASFQELVKNFPKSDKVAQSQKSIEELSK